jgi:hypothetical protein
VNVEISEHHITIVLKMDGMEFGAEQLRELLKRVHKVEQEWEEELGERSAFLVDPVRFETSKVITSFHQTGQPLRFADEH